MTTETALPTQQKETTSVVEKQKTPKLPAFSKLLPFIAGGFLVLVLTVTVGYFLYENWVITTLASMQRDFLKKELAITQELSEFYQEQYEEDLEAEESQAESESDAEFSEIPTIAVVSQSFDEIKSDMEINFDRFGEYDTLLRQHRDAYVSFQPKTRFLFGPTKQFVDQLFQYQLAYYHDEVADNELHVAAQELNLAFVDLRKAKVISDVFTFQTGFLSDFDEVSSLFSEISSLEKFTNDDFVLDAVEKHQESFPYYKQAQDAYITFLKTFYLVAKDATAGDEDSFYYKMAKLQDDFIALQAIDEERLSEQHYDQTKLYKKNMSESLYQVHQTIEGFSGKNLFGFTLVSKQDWDQPRSICRLYGYKKGLYSATKDSQPEGDTTEEILKELDKIVPRFGELDQKAAENLSYFADDEYLVTECKDGDEVLHTFRSPRFDDQSSETTDSD